MTPNISFKTLLFLNIAYFCLSVSLGCLETAEAQVATPDRNVLFLEDALRKPVTPRRLREGKQTGAFLKAKPQTIEGIPYDIDAPVVRFDSANKKVIADGGISITHGSGVFEAQSGELDLATNQASLKDDVFISDKGTTISAESAEMNLEEFTGEINQSKIDFVDGTYVLFAEKARKVSKLEYELEDVKATSCRCPEGDGDCVPWHIEASEAEIAKEGYGEVWNATIRVWDVPVLYTPYLLFPVKTKRQTGFLPASIGSANEGGFSLELPFFWAINESTDATITPLIETSTRYGSKLELRKLFSATHSLEFGGAYLNESWRDGDLQGTVVSGLDDPTIDEERAGFYLDQTWQTSVAGHPVQMILDGNYVSDDLYLREFDSPKIAPFNTRYVTSRAVVRTPLPADYSFDLSSEYTQAMITDDDIVFQRLPDVNISGVHRFRPFGQNSLGAKLSWSNNLQAVNFERKDGFEGWRYEATENFRVPFRFRNFFRSEVAADVKLTKYDMRETMLLPDSEGNLTEPSPVTDSSDRIVPSLSYKMSTAVEKVFDVGQGNALARLTELGLLGRTKKLTRLKHTIEPGIRYRLTPYVDQLDTPQFDSSDRLAQKNLVTLELNQSLFGRYDDRNPILLGVEESAPEVEDLESLSDKSAIENPFGFESRKQSLEAAGVPKRATIRELARFKLSQSFDIQEDRKDEDPLRRPLSDLGAELVLLPNEYIGFHGRTNFDVEDREFRSYTLAANLKDKRGDELRARLSFVEKEVRQLETSAQLRVTDRLRLGYYSRYDDLVGEFIENRAGIRILSECNCWVFDVEFADKINPDRSEVSFVLTLVGLGEFGNSLFRSDSDDS